MMGDGPRCEFGPVVGKVMGFEVAGEESRETERGCGWAYEEGERVGDWSQGR